MDALRRLLGSIGRMAEAITEHAGQLGLLVWSVLTAFLRLQVSRRSVVRQIYIIGVQSVPIVMVTAILSGIVTSQQGGYQFTGAVPLYVLGSVVVEAVVLELAPVLTAIVLVGRVGARITAELGTMKVSEQIDALYSLGRDPIALLAAPRIVAGVVALPLLTGMAIIVGIVAGQIAAQATVGLGWDTFFYGARLYWHSWDLVYSMLKSVTFGFIIPLVAVHMGMRTGGGAAGVGRQTTAAVMFMTLAILFADALFPPLLLQ